MGEGRLLARARIPQPPVPLARPLLPPAAPVVRAQHLVEGIALEPGGVLVLEGLEARGQLGDGGAGSRHRALAQEGLPRLLERLALGAEDVAVLNAGARPRPRRDEHPHTILAQEPSPGGIIRQGGERHVHHVAREERPVIRRGIVLGRLALGAELDAGEAQLAGEREEALAALGIGRAPAEVLLWSAGEARVLEAQDEVAHVERGQGRRDVASVLFGQGARHRRRKATLPGRAWALPGQASQQRLTRAIPSTSRTTQLRTALIERPISIDGEGEGVGSQSREHS